MTVLRWYRGRSPEIALVAVLLWCQCGGRHQAGHYTATKGHK